jgi:hypothetical protein
MKIFAFELAKGDSNESQHVYQGVTVFSYIAYVQTDAPAKSAVLASLMDSGVPDALLNVSATWWGTNQVLVQVTTLQQLGKRDHFTVAVMQEGAKTYGPVNCP